MRRPGTFCEGPIRVTHVIDTLGSGGAERQLVTTLAHLDPASVHSQVVALSDANDHWREGIEALGVPVRSLHLASARQIPGAFLELRRLVRSWDSHLVHTHLRDGNLLGRLAGRWEGVPVVSSLHNPDHEPEVWTQEGFRHPWRQQILRGVDSITARTCCSHLIAVSEYIADSAARRLHVPRDQITVIPNPVKLGSAPRPVSLGLPADAVAMLTVARVVPQKGILDLVAALPLVTTSPNLHLVIAGATTNRVYTAAVRRAVVDLGLVNRIHLLGSRHDIEALLSTADLFVMASRYEGFGIALAEALAAGVPCVATRIPPFEELIEDGRTGLLAEVASPSSLAQRIEDIAGDPERARAMGRAAATVAATRFNPGLLADTLTGVYLASIHRTAIG